MGLKCCFLVKMPCPRLNCWINILSKMSIHLFLTSAICHSEKSPTHSCTCSWLAQFSYRLHKTSWLFQLRIITCVLPKWRVFIDRLKVQICTFPGHAPWVRVCPCFKEGTSHAIPCGCEHTHTVKEETLPAIRHRCGVNHNFSRGRIVFLHARHHRYAYGYRWVCWVPVCQLFLQTYQFAKWNFICAMLPTELMIYIWLFWVLTIT